MKHSCKPLARAWLLVSLIGAIASCATPSRPEQDRRPASSESRTTESVESASVGGTRILVTSLSNNGLTGFNVDRGRAEAAAREFEQKSKAGGNNERANLEAQLAAERLAGVPIDRVLDTARRLVDAEMKQDTKRDLPSVARLELGLAAIRARRFTMAQYFIDQAKASSNPRVKAAAITAQGAIFAEEGRLPEAVAEWNEALRVSPNFEPAALNIGFTALRFGDAKTASRMLGANADNWFAQSGLVVAERLSGDKKAADRYCSQVLGRRPSHKPTLYNCALHEYFSNADLAKARQYIDRMIKTNGGDPKFDEQALQLATEIDNAQPAGGRLRERGAGGEAAPPAQGGG